MTTALLPAWAGIKPVIGMVHLLPLPGSPRYSGDREVVLEAALRDVEALTQGGVHGILVENFGDAPFFPGPVPAPTLTHLAVLVREIGRHTDLPVGVNVLRNDGRGALAVAHAGGGVFIRVNVLTGARLTDQGIIPGEAHEIARDRSALGAGEIRILADVRVKHSAPFAERPLEDEVRDTWERGGADGIIVSGPGTGRPVDREELRRVKRAAGTAPVLVGSGITPESIEALHPEADGFIVGTALKERGATEGSVDPERVRALMARVG